jgi:hypothetical protein
MREIDEKGRELCEIQGRLFEKSLSFFSGSSPIFIRRFMLSETASYLDQGTYLLGCSTDEDVFLDLKREYGKSSYGKERYTAEELHWIGYLYRYWAYTQETASRKIFRLCPGKDMVSYYFPLHTQDPKASLDSILEAKGISAEEINRLLLDYLREMRKKK